MNEEQVQGRREEEKEGDIILLRTHICSYESAQGPLCVISCLLGLLLHPSVIDIWGTLPDKALPFFLSTHKRIVKPLARLLALWLLFKG